MANKNDKFSGDQLRYAGVGFEFAGAAAVFCLAGYFIDQHWQCQPYGLLIGAVLGIVVGAYLLIKAALMLNKEEDDPRNR